MKYRHEIAEAAVEALTAASTDHQIVIALTDLLLAGQPLPLRLTLNHNAKAAPCPVLIDKPGVKVSSVTLHDVVRARNWISEALLRGYGVACGTRKDLELRTIADVKRSIEFRERMATWRAAGIDDDFIPF